MEKICMNIQQRDILLVPFPFADQRGSKVRPVYVISKNEFNQTSQDIITLGITSNISKEYYKILIGNNNLEQGYLFETSCIKVENILKIDKSLVIKKIGKTKKAIFKETLQKMYTLFQESD